MKKIKIILCIAIIVICMQVTYSRFVTKQPNGNIDAKVGHAIIDIEQIDAISTSYTDVGVPRLIDINDTITYSFSVNNYNANGEISDANLKCNIYVVFYNANGKVMKDFTCSLLDELGNNSPSTILAKETTLNINGTDIKLPAGTVKFNPQNIIIGGEKNQKKFNLEIKLNIDSLPTSQITPKMEMYCVAEQSV